ncbi:MAG: FAD-dependent oxidoreductase [Palaeococcus sp.]|uniref:FAD-dependent oxidoreductase n=1 Tax=Palaeococcus sp. (in: euryarchaeotes) TaxID=2820298 RepID=UPI0025F09743|nr:FAD-dependent oxidoreductase [Palaeococcus sp. (in: euryarchaeotes)]MCD6559806.1 FAD-dependent oxidoreductase [Palaeococcus sp. (in: euryarchaeotes)]
MRLLIVGNGPAGFSLAKELYNDFEVEILDKEGAPYYNKPMLSHYIAGLIDREKLFMYSEEWYEEKGIKLRLGVNARRVDISSKRVIADGGSFDYDILVLATGAVVLGDVKKSIEMERMIKESLQFI